jgi:DNA-binding LacI/PurR family transcriptional regulator
MRVLSRGSNLVSLVMGEITNPFYAEVLDGFLAELEGHGLRVLLKRIDAARTADEAVTEALAYKVRGVIVTSSVVSAETAAACAASAVPVVLFNRTVRGLAISSIACDNIEAGRTAANLLLDAGHVRPAFVSGSRQATSNLDRQKGFSDRLVERTGVEPLVLGDEHAYEVGAEAARSLLALAEAPDAFFCASDALAFGALDALRALGRRVPQDVSVLGFDDIPMAAWAAFDLSTFRQPRRRMVQEAVNALMARIAGEPPGPVRLVPAEFLRRGTLRAH